jgi:hypothetical protein
MINDQSTRLMAMALIQGPGEEYRSIGTSAFSASLESKPGSGFPI